MQMQAQSVTPSSLPQAVPMTDVTQFRQAMAAESGGPAQQAVRALAFKELLDVSTEQWKKVVCALPTDVLSAIVGEMRRRAGSQISASMAFTGCAQRATIFSGFSFSCEKACMSNPVPAAFAPVAGTNTPGMCL